MANLIMAKKKMTELEIEKTAISIVERLKDHCEHSSGIRSPKDKWRCVLGGALMAPNFDSCSDDCKRISRRVVVKISKLKPVMKLL